MAQEQVRDVAGTGSPTIPASPENPNWKIYFTHFATGAKVAFEGWVTDFSDNFSSTWNEETAYGRMDPLVTFQRTGRKISMSFDVPAKSQKQSLINTGNVDLLIKFLYPVYETGARDFNNVLKAAPLLGLKWANLIANNPNSGEQLVGYITGINYAPVIEAGLFMSHKATKLVPQLLRVQFEFTVLHTILPGWSTVVDTAEQSTVVQEDVMTTQTEMDYLFTQNEPVVNEDMTRLVVTDTTTVTTDNQSFGGQPRANSRFPHAGKLVGGTNLPSDVVDTTTDTRAAEMSAAAGEAILEGSGYDAATGEISRPLPSGVDLQEYNPLPASEGVGAVEQGQCQVGWGSVGTCEDGTPPIPIGGYGGAGPRSGN